MAETIRREILSHGRRQALHHKGRFQKSHVLPGLVLGDPEVAGQRAVVDSIDRRPAAALEQEEQSAGEVEQGEFPSGKRAG